MTTLSQKVLFCALVSFSLAACTRTANLGDEALRNAAYSSDSFEGLTVKLKDGRYQGALASSEATELEKAQCILV